MLAIHEILAQVYASNAARKANDASGINAAQHRLREMRDQYAGLIARANGWRVASDLRVADLVGRRRARRVEVLRNPPLEMVDHGHGFRLATGRAAAVLVHIYPRMGRTSVEFANWFSRTACDCVGDPDALRTHLPPGDPRAWSAWFPGVTSAVVYTIGEIERVAWPTEIRPLPDGGAVAA